MLFSPEEEGQGLVEYALILIFVAMVVIIALAVLGPVLGDAYTSVVDSLP